METGIQVPLQKKFIWDWVLPSFHGGVGGDWRRIFCQAAKRLHDLTWHHTNSAPALRENVFLEPLADRRLSSDSSWVHQKFEKNKSTTSCIAVDLLITFSTAHSIVQHILTSTIPPPFPGPLSYSKVATSTATQPTCKNITSTHNCMLKDRQLRPMELLTIKKVQNMNNIARTQSDWAAITHRTSHKYALFSLSHDRYLPTY